MKLTIKTVFQYKVKCNFLIKDEVVASEILLDEKCQIKLLGAESDVMLTIDDFDKKDIVSFQSQIDEFIDQQSIKLLNMSAIDGNHYQMENTILQGSPTDSTGKCTNEWYEVSELDNATVIDSINNYFLAHVTAFSYRP